LLEYGVDSNVLYESLCDETENKNSLVHISWIQCIEPEDKKKFPNFSMKDIDVEKIKKIISAANAVLTIIDQDDLLAFYGIKSDQRPEASKLKM